jgi:hypothetical protein
MSNAYVGDYDGPSPQGIDWNPGGLTGLARFGNDRSTIVHFHKQSVPNEQKSIHAGRPISDDVVFVSYQHPGEREQKGDRPMQEADKYRWPQQWQQFVRREEQTVDGTPVDLLFPNHPSIAANLRSAGFTVVEQLANASASGMQSLGLGAQDYVNHARAYLEHARKGVGFHEMKKELADRDAKIRVQDQRIDLLTQQLDQLLKQNAAVLSAMPGAPGLVVGPAVVAMPPQPFAMPPIPAKMPAAEAAESPKAAAARASWARRKAAAAHASTSAQQESEPEPANAAD